MIPIIINNFNRLTTTRKLVSDLKRLGYTEIHILDNNSTYPPLLEWYDTEPCIVYRLNDNLQGLSIYNSSYIEDFKEYPWIVYTDSDIELNPDTPPLFIEYLINLAEKYSINKVGLAIRIDDLPETPFATEYKNWEQKYWTTSPEPDVYEAHIDTTFCIIKPTLPFDYIALRIAGNLTCRHIPWYNDFDNLDEEEKYFIETSLEVSTYKRYYYTHIGK
jgi:GT2 family glycosyltransferase